MNLPYPFGFLEPMIGAIGAMFTGILGFLGMIFGGFF